MADTPGMPDFGFGKGKGQPPRPPSQVPKIEFKLPRGKGMVWAGAGAVALLLFLVVFVTRRGGIVEISDREVAVIVNYLTGEKELVVNPGYKIFIPFVEQAFLFDKSPNKFIMEGDRDIDSNHVSRLTVRANDGSNFWFETIEIQYQLIADKAPFVLGDSGQGEGFKQNWMRAYARSVLRDVYGQYSAEEMADPTNYESTRGPAQTRLNELLNPHGIRVLQIVTPKPSFEERYERAIADRKVADQTVEKLKAQAQQLVAERERRLAGVERDKKTEYEALLGSLEADRIGAERDVVRIRKAADAYKIGKVAEGTAAKERLTQEAVALEEQARKSAEGLAARVEAVAKRGDVLVREKLAEKLARITFEVVPYRRDPSPTRIEHMGSVPESGRAAAAAAVAANESSAQPSAANHTAGGQR